MIFILGIIVGMLLALIAIIVGMKISVAVEKYEKEEYAKEHPKSMAKIIKMENMVKKILEE